MVLLAGSAVGCSRDRPHPAAPPRRLDAGGTARAARAASPRECEALLDRLRQALSDHRPPLGLAVGSVRRDQAISSLVAGALDLALVALPPSAPGPGEDRGVERRLGRRDMGLDPVAVVVNATNRSVRLTLPDLARILRGEVTRWDQVGGDRLELIPYLQQGESAVRELVTVRVLGGGAAGPTVRTVPDTATALESVRRTPGGLALVLRSALGPGDLAGRGIKGLVLAAGPQLRGALATEAPSLPAGSYPLWVRIWLVWRLGADPTSRRLDALLRSRWGRGLGGRLGLTSRASRPVPKPAP